MTSRDPKGQGGDPFIFKTPYLHNGARQMVAIGQKTKKITWKNTRENNAHESTLDWSQSYRVIIFLVITLSK